MAKEAINSGKPGNRWNNADLGATVLGGIFMGVTIALFHGKGHRIIGITGKEFPEQAAKNGNR